MKILKNERNGNKVKLEIEEDAAEFQKAAEKAVCCAAAEMKLPGFRKGKVPRSLVEKNLDQKAIDDHAAQRLIGRLYPLIIKQANIDPVDYPKVEILKLERGLAFKFTLEVETYPEVKLGKYRGVAIEKLSAEVKEEDVLNVLGNITNRLAKWNEVSSRPVKEGDMLDLEIEARAEDAEVKTWPREMQFYPVGSKYISKEFDQQLEGAELNQNKEFTIKFKADYPVKDVADKEVSFKIKVAKISEKELLPLDDEFAKKISSFGTMAEFKAELTKNLEEERKQESETDLKNKLVEEVSKQSEIDVPRPMIDAEIEIMLDELKGSLSRSNLTLENYLKSTQKTEENLIEEFTAPATSRVKGKIVLKAVAKKENLAVTGTDLDEEISILSKHENKSPEEYRKMFKENQIEYIKDYLLRRKALDFLVKNAKIKEALRQAQGRPRR